MEPVIEIRGLSKQYFLGERPGLYDNLRELLVRAVLGDWRHSRDGRRF